MRIFALFAVASLLIAAVMPAFADEKPKAAPPANVTSLLKELGKFQDDEASVNTHIKTFDTLDFDVYSNQKWERLSESHSKDIVVHYPDGSITKGLANHIDMLKPMFVFAPDTKITSHPVKFGKGEWTAVIGEMKGTFTIPMPIGGGKTIAPTNKPFRILMATIGHWNKDNVMDEEFLFWDNAEFAKQIGLGQ